MAAPGSFVMLAKTLFVRDQMLKRPAVFMLVTQIALRARYSKEESLDGLQYGEAMIGDFKSIGITRQQYRDAINFLKTHQKATFRTTNRGTIAKLTDSSIYITPAATEEPPEKPAENQQRTSREPLNKKEIRKEGDKGKRLSKEEACALFHQNLPTFHRINGEIEDFYDHRIQIKKPLSANAIKLLCNEFLKWGEDVAIKGIEKSIVSGWAGVFHPGRDQYNDNRASARPASRPPAQRTKLPPPPTPETTTVLPQHMPRTNGATHPAHDNRHNL